MKTPAPEFGGADVVRHTCDNPNCGRPIVLCWKSRDGEYCSNKCMRSAEAAKNPPPDETQEQEENEMKNATAKAKTTKKTAAPEKKAATTVREYVTYPDNAVIHVIDKDHKLKGLSAKRFKFLKDGATVAEYTATSKEKVDAKRSGFACISYFLTGAIKQGLIKVGGATPKKTAPASKPAVKPAAAPPTAKAAEEAAAS